jgi:hypothetical protein
MTFQEVIKSGQQLVEPVEQVYFNSNFFLTALLVSIIVLLIIVFLKVGSYNVFIISSMTFLLSYVISFILFIFFNNNTEEYIKYIKEVENWRVDVAYPYIDSLPYLERELDSVILNVAKMDSGKYIDELPLIISYTKNGVTITVSDIYPIEKSLKDGEKPYLNYKYLKNDLGHNVIKGDYFEKIILPKNFKLEPSSN